MPRNISPPILASAPGLEALMRFVQLLNTEDYWSASLINGRQKVGGDYRPIKEELRRLVRSWFRSGPNVCRLLDIDPKIDRAAREFRPYFIPTRSGTARLAYRAVPEYLVHAKPHEIAIGLFLHFLINPINARLGGPCKHCDRYYLMRTKRQVVYCSQRCGTRHTSQISIRAARQKRHENKLKKAKHFLAKWAETKTSENWIDWVSRRTLISKHWLTRSAKRGELAVPVK